MTGPSEDQTSGWPESGLALRLLVATVWLVFGLGFKVLDLVPRHRRIVAAILGEEVAGPVTVLVGLGEVAIASWVLVGWRPFLCAAVPAQRCQAPVWEPGLILSPLRGWNQFGVPVTWGFRPRLTAAAASRLPSTFSGGR